jgi:hypothetical protein
MTSTNLQHYYLIATCSANFYPEIMLFPMDLIPEHLMRSINEIKSFSIDPQKIYYVNEENNYVQINSHEDIVIPDNIVEDIKQIEKLTYAWRPAFDEMFIDENGITPEYIEKSMYIGNKIDINDVPQILGKITEFYDEKIIVDDMLFIKSCYR